MWPTSAHLDTHQPDDGGRLLPDGRAGHHRRKSQEARFEETQSAQGSDMSAVQGQVSAPLAFTPPTKLTRCACSRQLQDGSILQHGVADGSKVTLLPNVETGLVVSLSLFTQQQQQQTFVLPSLIFADPHFIIRQNGDCTTQNNHTLPAMLIISKQK